MAISGVPLNKTDIIKAIQLKKGIISHVSAYLGCHPSTIYKWRDEDSDIRNHLEDARIQAEEEKKSYIEQITRDMYPAMHKKIMEGDTTATIYAMKTFGGHMDGSGITKIILADPCDGKDD